jgi:CDP-6-deoxy-D-xylo-4-hexulose-3-dehydrase
MFYELASSSWNTDEYENMQKVIDSGYFTMGKHVKQFEKEFAAYCGKQFAVMVNSGSSANLIAVASLFYKKDNPLKPGDEVIVPSISWSTTYHPLHQYGLKLKFVDVDLNTLNMDVSQLEAALTPNTKAIVGVSILGNPAELDIMQAFAKKHDLYFIEDNCESMDAELNGQKAGTFGLLNTFSFFFSHHISTMEGGMILTDDKELYHILLSLRSHGWSRDLPDDSVVYEKSDDDFFEAYRFILPGYNVRPLEFSGAIGLAQLKKLPELTTARRNNLAHFQKLFSNNKHFIIQKEHGKSSTFAFTFVLREEIKHKRKEILSALRAAEIGFRIITGGCLLEHDVIKHYDYTTHGDIYNARYAHHNGFFVANHAHDITPQLDKLAEVLDKVMLKETV